MYSDSGHKILDEHTSDGRVDGELLLGYCIDAANGLAYLAENNFIHRDLNASSIMVKFSNGKEECKVVCTAP